PRELFVLVKRAGSQQCDSLERICEPYAEDSPLGLAGSKVPRIIWAVRQMSFSRSNYVYRQLFMWRSRLRSRWRSRADPDLPLFTMPQSTGYALCHEYPRVNISVPVAEGR